jgi:hypothetical protein
MNQEPFFTDTREIRSLLPETAALHIAESEADSRDARISTVQFLNVQTPAGGKGNVTMPGTVTVFVGRRGTPALEDVRRSAAGEQESSNRLTDRLRSQFSARKRVSLQDAVKRVVAEPVFAELRLRNRTVARHLFAPDMETLCVATLPYTGGPIDPNEFELVEYLKSGTQDGLDAVILKHDPPLTAAEQAALSAVGRSSINAAVASPCDADLVEVAVMVLLFAALLKPADFTQFEHISDARVRELGPQATVRELMQMRRQLLKTK